MSKRRAPNDQKGRLVEEIAALLHRYPGVEVQTRARLPSLTDPERLVEIDVLLSTSIAGGYPVRIALGCKNEAKRIGPEKINEFISRLDDVGIPVSHGVFVSASRYTPHAISRAKGVRMRTLLLQGLSADRLGAAITAASHSLIYLLPEWKTIQLVDRKEFAVPIPSSPGFVESTLPEGPVDAPGLALILNHLWKMWVSGEIPDLVGDHLILLRLPERFPLSSSEPPLEKGGDAFVQLRVIALALTLAAEGRRFDLIDAETQRLERIHIETHIEPPKTGPQMLTTLTTEAELESYLQSVGTPMRVVGRMRVPRILHEFCYWPPSAQAEERAARLIERGEPLIFEAVEGTELSRIWELFQANRHGPKTEDKAG